MKWTWPGHVTRQESNRWTERILQWRPREHKKSTRRLKRWVDAFKATVGLYCHQLDQD